MAFERRISILHACIIAYTLRVHMYMYIHTLICKHLNIHAAVAAAKSHQLCPTLCDPMDCSLPDSSVHGVFQARVLEWGAIAFSQVTIIVCIYINTKFFKDKSVFHTFHEHKLM